MFDLDNTVDLFIDNLKKLFFPDEWIELDLKFSKSEIFTMLFLDKREEATMTDLVEYINIPMSTATGIVDRLVNKGYMTRERSETDRRIVVLSLSKEGSSLIKKLKGVIYRYMDMALKDLTEEEKHFMAGVVFKIMNNLQRAFSSIEPVEQNSNEVKTINIE